MIYRSSIREYKQNFKLKTNEVILSIYLKKIINNLNY